MTAVRLRVRVLGLTALGLAASAALLWLCLRLLSASEAPSAANAMLVAEKDSAAPDGAADRPAESLALSSSSPSSAHASTADLSALRLPARGTSVLDVVAALDGRARGGDAVAACRLAVEVLTCSPQNLDRQLRSGHARSQIEALPPEDPRRSEWLARLEDIADRNAQRARACEGADGALLRRAPHYALMGALRRNPTSTAIFLSGDQVTAGMLVADPALAAAYRQHGWPMLRGLIESGHPTGAFLWHAALPRTGTGGVQPLSMSPLSELIPADWRRPELAWALWQRVSQAIEAPVFGLPPRSTDAAAQTDAEALFQRHFARSPWMHLRDVQDEPPDSPLRGLDVDAHYQRQLNYCDPAYVP